MYWFTGILTLIVNVTCCMIKCVTLLLHSLKHLPPVKHQHKNTFKIYLIYINLQARIYYYSIILIYQKIVINPVHVTGLFLYPLKTSENQRFSYIFRGYRKRPVAKNGLNRLILKFSKL